IFRLRLLLGLIRRLKRSLDWIAMLCLLRILPIYLRLRSINGLDRFFGLIGGKLTEVSDLKKMANVDNPIWDIVDSPCQDEWEQESGQVVYNKRQNWKYYSNGDGADYSALMLASYF